MFKLAHRIKRKGLIRNKLNVTKSTNPISKGVNVYEKTIDQGFGDYIRGCFCMLQILTKLNIPFDMDISDHPIKHWIQTTTNYNYKNVERISHYHCGRPDRYETILHKLQYATGTYCFFCNEYPMNPITHEERIFIRNKLLPTPEMIQCVMEKMNHLGIQRGQYHVIHLRCGDSCLVDGVPYPPNHTRFLEAIKSIHTDIPIVLLSDSYDMKQLIHTIYPHIIIPMNKPVHSCKNVSVEQAKEILCDFFLFANASRITNYSIYEHGSGFSQWAAELYNVPYQFTCLQEN